MILTEYKSKELLAQYGVPIPPGRAARTGLEAEERCREIVAEKYVVKAQIGAGGRGLAGGVRFAATPSAVREASEALLGQSLITAQTGETGETVREVYVEAAVEIADAAYLAIVLDPQTARPMLLASASGGVDFEEAAKADPDLVHRHLLGEGDVAAFLKQAGLKNEAGAARLIAGAHKAFVANDMVLLEINPLARTGTGDWLAVDAKVVLDANAMFRHPELEALVDDSNATPAEQVAQENEINLVKLPGNIGVVVNGAGLGLATNDMLTDAGGRPANFMDIRTTATSFQIAKGVELLLNDKSVDAILVNVHGGGMTVCDTVAEGVSFAYSRSSRKPPLAVRFAGQNADWAYRVIRERRLPATVCRSISEAVTTAVSLSNRRAA